MALSRQQKQTHTQFVSSKVDTMKNEITEKVKKAKEVISKVSVDHKLEMESGLRCLKCSNEGKENEMRPHEINQYIGD